MSGELKAYAARVQAARERLTRENTGTLDPECRVTATGGTRPQEDLPAPEWMSRPIPPDIIPPDLPERISRRIRIEASEDGCWLIGGGDYYAPVRLTDDELARWPDLARHVAAHRLMQRIIEGEPFDRCFEVVHHKCERPGCVKPSHLVTLLRTEHMQEHLRLDAAKSRLA